MEYDAASLGNKLDLLTLEGEYSRFFGTSETVYPVTQHYVPEEQNPRSYNFVFQKLTFNNLWTVVSISTCYCLKGCHELTSSLRC